MATHQNRNDYMKEWYSQRTTIFIKKETHDRLKKINIHGKPYDTLINQLLDVWDIVKEEWKQQQTKQ